MNAFSPNETSVVICCAGMGTRLGIGTTKALVDICGKPLIIRLLEELDIFDDIRIVAGFEAEKLVTTTKSFRKDIMYVFNYDYETTGTADSLKKGMSYARKYILSLDGDTLINYDDFKNFFEIEYECLGISPITSVEPIMATVKNDTVLNLSKSQGNMQWSGIAKFVANRLVINSPHVYDNLNEILPLKARIMRTREIDTQEDYEKAIEWFENGAVDW